MVLKIILAISLVGFLGFEVYNLIHAVIQRKRAKQLQKQAAEQSALDDTQKSDKEVNE